MGIVGHRAAGADLGVWAQAAAVSEGTALAAQLSTFKTGHVGHEPYECLSCPSVSLLYCLSYASGQLTDCACLFYRKHPRGEGSTRPEPQQGSGSWVGTQAVWLEHLFFPVSNGPAVNVL